MASCGVTFSPSWSFLMVFDMSMASEIETPMSLIQP